MWVDAVKVERNRQVLNFVEFLMEACKYEFSFRGAQAQEINFEVIHEEIWVTTGRRCCKVGEATWRERDE